MSTRPRRRCGSSSPRATATSSSRSWTRPPGPPPTLDLGALESTELDPGDDGGALGLAIVAGLVDDVTVAGHEDGSPGTRVTMRWPLSPSAPGLPAAGTGRATAAAVHQDDTAL